MRAFTSRGTRLCRDLSTIALTIGLAAGFSTPVLAQDEASTEEAAPTPVNDQAIIVTGSRVGRSTFETTNPVTVLDSEDIENLGLSDVGDIVAQMPQNSNFFSGNNIGMGNFNVGAQLVNLRGLNPFFGTRSLTLVDTRRVVPTTIGGGVDITLIPSMLVERTETVTGGASAMYGSDAIAGVVNIILDKKLDGFKAQADFSRTGEGDGNEYHAAAAYGTDFSGGRGHLVVGGEYQKSEAIGNCAEVRDWCAEGNTLYTNPDYATNGQPHYIIGPNGKVGNTSLTGVLVPCDVNFFGTCWNLGSPAVQFNEEGTALISYDPGAYATAGGSSFGAPAQGGKDEYSVPVYSQFSSLRPEVERYSTLAHLSYDFSDSIAGFLEGSYAHSAAVNPDAYGSIGPYAYSIGNLGIGGTFYVGNRIFADNAYLTPEVAAQIGPNGAMLGREMSNLVDSRNETTNSTWRLVGGLEGEFGAGWQWDASFSHGENKNDQHLYNNVVSAFLNYALDAVDDGSGNIVCGVNVPGRVNPLTGAPYTSDDIALANSAGDCVPINLFGTDNASQEAIDYVFRTLNEHSTITQDVFNVNLRGDLFDGWGAGPIKLATGAEWRREKLTVTHDIDQQPYYNNFFLSYYLDFGGKTEVLEGYAELNVPVLRDSPIGRYLELDGAIRATRNKSVGTLGDRDGESASHEFITWKISGIWDVTDWLRLRGTRSRDVRAAQFRDLFQTVAPLSGALYYVTNPWTGSTTDYVVEYLNGNVNLKPEKADTITAGFILSPGGALSGFRFSADWYQIEIKDAILGLPYGPGMQNIVTQCYQGVQQFCDLIEGEGAGGDITSIDNSAMNLQSFITRGVDFEAAYTISLGEGSLSLRVMASLLYDQIFTAGFGSDPVDYAGQSGPTASFGTFNTSPYWQGNAFVTYNKGPFTGTVQFRYVGPGRYLTVTSSGGAPVDPSDPGYDPSDPNSISDNSVPSALYVNLNASFDITEEFQVFGSINNAFDKDPPIAPGGNGFPTNPVYFDTYGRTFKVGARVKF